MTLPLFSSLRRCEVLSGRTYLAHIVLAPTVHTAFGERLGLDANAPRIADVSSAVALLPPQRLSIYDICFGEALPFNKAFSNDPAVELPPPAKIANCCIC